MSEMNVLVLFAQIPNKKFNAEVRYDRNLKMNNFFLERSPFGQIQNVCIGSGCCNGFDCPSKPRYLLKHWMMLKK